MHQLSLSIQLEFLVKKILRSIWYLQDNVAGLQTFTFLFLFETAKPSQLSLCHITEGYV
jgi:hypothetical protein